MASPARNSSQERRLWRGQRALDTLDLKEAKALLEELTL